MADIAIWIFIGLIGFLLGLRVPDDKEPAPTVAELRERIEEAKTHWTDDQWAEFYRLHAESNDPPPYLIG